MTFSEEIIQAVWEKARGVPGTNTMEWRQDQCGAWLHREQYNNENSEHGWKILSVAAGGGETIDSFQPFHYRNNFDIASARPKCQVKAERADIAPDQYVNKPHNTAS